jgi:hypothetical protein
MQYFSAPASGIYIFNFFLKCCWEGRKGKRRKVEGEEEFGIRYWELGGKK